MPPPPTDSGGGQLQADPGLVRVRGSSKGARVGHLGIRCLSRSTRAGEGGRGSSIRRTPGVRSPPPLVRRGVAPAWGRRRARPSAWSPTVGHGASAVRGPFPAHAPPHAMRANPSSHPRIPRTQLACARSPPATRRAPRAASGRFLPGSPALGCCAVTSRPPSAKGRARRKTGPPGREPRDSC